MSAKIFNKGVIAGVVTILSGLAAVFDASTGAVPALLISILGVLGGFVTTKDSIDLR